MSPSMQKATVVGQCPDCGLHLVMAPRRCPGCKIGCIDIEADIQALWGELERLRLAVFWITMHLNIYDLDLSKHYRQIRGEEDGEDIKCAESALTAIQRIARAAVEWK